MAGDERKNTIRQCISLLFFIFAFFTLACTILRDYSNRAAGQNTESEVGTHGERRSVIAVVLVQVYCCRISYDCMLGEVFGGMSVASKKRYFVVYSSNETVFRAYDIPFLCLHLSHFTTVYDRQCVAWHSSSFSCCTTFFLCRRFYCEYVFFVQHSTLTIRLWDISAGDRCRNIVTIIAVLCRCLFASTCVLVGLPVWFVPYFIVSTACVTRSEKMSHFGEKCTK